MIAKDKLGGRVAMKNLDDAVHQHRAAIERGQLRKGIFIELGNEADKDNLAFVVHQVHVGALVDHVFVNIGAAAHGNKIALRLAGAIRRHNLNMEGGGRCGETAEDGGHSKKLAHDDLRFNGPAHSTPLTRRGKAPFSGPALP